MLNVNIMSENKSCENKNERMKDIFCFFIYFEGKIRCLCEKLMILSVPIRRNTSRVSYLAYHKWKIYFSQSYLGVAGVERGV